MSTPDDQSPEFGPDESGQWEASLHNLDFDTSSLPSLDRESLTYEQRTENSRELIRMLPGLRLSSFTLGTELLLETATTLASLPGWLRMELKAWPNQTKIEPGQNVRARVIESIIPGIPDDSEIQIIGPSIDGTMLDKSHYGEVRRDCSLIVVPITFTEAQQTETFDKRVKSGQIELAKTGPLKGKYVVPNFTNPPIKTPEVMALYTVDKQTGENVRQQWSGRAALES